MEGIKGVYLKNMQLVKEGKLVCKQKECRFYNDCDNYSCSYLEPVDNLIESETRGMSYIVKNCPARYRTCNDCSNNSGKRCQDCTDCVISK